MHKTKIANQLAAIDLLCFCLVSPKYRKGVKVIRDEGRVKLGDRRMPD